MKNFIIKTERRIFDLLTEYVKRWIAKREYKKHKVDFMISMQWAALINLLVLAIAVPVMLYIAEGRIWQALFHGSIWTISAGFEAMNIYRTHTDTKVWYDVVFAMRKNPMYYEAHKQILEELYVSGRRRRLETLAFLIGITTSVVLLLSMLNFATHTYTNVNTFICVYLFINIGFSILQRYIFYVFDFDEPKPKEKKQKSSLTDIVLREWQNLIGGLSPSPAI